MLKWNFDVGCVDVIMGHNVHRINIKAAHFGAIVLKRKPPGGGGAMPNRTEIGLIEGDEIG